MPKYWRNCFKTNIKIWLIIVLFGLLIVSQCQRGRGSSSGGGSSFGGGSSYGRSYGSSSNYLGGGGSGLSYGIAGGGIFAVFCTLCCGCCAANRNNTASANGTFDQNQQMSPDAQFQRLKTIKNIVAPMAVSMDEFQRVRNQFFILINSSNSVFQYTQRGNSTRIYNTRVQGDMEGQFIHKIQLSGADQLGRWIGRGYFLASAIGPHVWWMKDYEDKNNAGQTGQSQFLIYESNNYNQYGWAGRWFYQGDQYDLEYSGSWSLTQPQPSYPIRNPNMINQNNQRKEHNNFHNPFDILAKNGQMNTYDK